MSTELSVVNTSVITVDSEGKNRKNVSQEKTKSGANSSVSLYLSMALV